MPEVSVTINGRVYRMACDAGQEEHLARLSKELDARIARLRDSFGEIGDTRLTVMAALMVADELSEMRRRLRAAEQEIEGLNDARHAATERIEANEKALADHKDHKFVKRLQDRRELDKLRGTYLLPLLEELCAGDRCHL